VFSGYVTSYWYSFGFGFQALQTRLVHGSGFSVSTSLGFRAPDVHGLRFEVQIFNIKSISNTKLFLVPPMSL
jgi:hypothetical protein